MKTRSTFRPFITVIVPLALAVGLSGCTLLGLGAAAGAAVGGCAVLDENEDDQVTQAEFSAGLYDAWDTDNDNRITEAEFEAGIDRGDIYADWSGDFDTWDTNNDASLAEAEFSSGVAENDNRVRWADRQCDDLGL